jgi:CelD/BcsL family acetyltransferase involved in cellulose biosynthesis
MLATNAKKYSFDILDDEESILKIIPEWEIILAESNGPEPVYQSPGFFHYLLATANETDRPKLLVIRQAGKVSGIVPLRLCTIRISFIFGKYQFNTPSNFLSGAIVLGSLPLLICSKENLDQLYEAIGLHFPNCDIVSHQAVPTDSKLWQYICTSKELKARHLINTLYGVRQCHTIPLPATFEDYEQQFSRKKRYNLNRQIRQLRDISGGTLKLIAIEAPEQVWQLIQAINSIVPERQRNEFLSEIKYTILAENRILLAYVLMAGTEVCALVAGTMANHVYQLPVIITNDIFSEFSPGTSMLHLMIEDLIARGMMRIEMGYGTPKHSHNSSNETSERTQVLLGKKTIKILLIFSLHTAARKLEKLMRDLLIQFRKKKPTVIEST